MRKVVVFGFVLLCVSTLSFLTVTPLERKTLNPDGTVNAPAPAKPAQVEVVNFPAVQAVSGTVNVGNLPASGSPHFVGITAATLSLAGEGQKVMRLSRTCSTEFPQTRVCEDIDLVRSIPPPPAFDSVAWVMRIVTLPSSQPDPYPQASCEDAEGIADCGVSGTTHPVACCGF